jgi:site-specific recombinase XerD
LIEAALPRLFAQLGRYEGKAYIPDAGKRPIISILKERIMTDFNKLLFSFKEHLKVKNYSPRSIEAYSYHLLGFFAHLESIGITDVKRVTRDVLQDYQLKITTGQGYAVGTISIKVRSVKRFFEYLEETGKLLVNPAEHIKEPEKETRLPRAVLTPDEARKILDQPDTGTMIGLRSRAMLEVLYSTGIRLEELISLTLYDCDLQGGLLRIKGKFSRDRVVPLGKHAIKFLKQYIKHARQHHGERRRNPEKRREQTKSLFVSKMRTPLSAQVIETMVRRYAKQAGVKKHVTPHVFRHTFATELLRNGADLRAVQKMLGHSGLSVTHIYTHVAGVEVKKTHSQSHPRERDKTDKEKDINPDIKMIKGKYRHE